jgi:hypothetical protein
LGNNISVSGVSSLKYALRELVATSRMFTLRVGVCKTTRATTASLDRPPPEAFTVIECSPEGVVLKVLIDSVDEKVGVPDAGLKEPVALFGSPNTLS